MTFVGRRAGTLIQVLLFFPRQGKLFIRMWFDDSDENDSNHSHRPRAGKLLSVHLELGELQWGIVMLASRDASCNTGGGIGGEGEGVSTLF